MAESRITITVDGVDGLPTMGTPIISFSPKTQAEFDAVVEACGGPCAFKHYGEAYASADVNGGVAHVNSVRGYVYSRPLASDIQALKDACPS